MHAFLSLLSKIFCSWEGDTPSQTVPVMNLVESHVSSRFVTKNIHLPANVELIFTCLVTREILIQLNH